MRLAFGFACANPPMDMSTWEGEIDQLALRGQLCGLNEDAINFVEGQQ
jgi:hypothetical protein